MPVASDIILDYAERGFTLIPVLEGRVRTTVRPGVIGRLSDIFHPLANIVTCARLSEANAGTTIAAMVDEYRAAHTPMLWIVGPASTPVDLGARLEAAGLHHSQKLDILTLTDLSRPIGGNEDVAIREVTPAEAPALSDFMAESYGIPPDITRLFNQSYASSPGKPRVRTYVAELDGTPVSWGNTMYLPGTSVVLLSGAGTSAEHRGRGIYSSLVARRIADAHAGGMDTAMIQAVQSTSSPICRKLGFEPVGLLDMYTWMPPE